MQEDISSKTGEGIYRRASLSLDKVTFNGNDGLFFEQDKDAKADEVTKKIPKNQITKQGEALDVVFLKIRRVLSAYSKKASMRTTEHNHKGETVTLYKPDGNEVGVAKDLRETYPLLKTQQIVYCLLPKEDKVVRLVVKGSSLGSEFKHPQGVYKFYDYLQSFASNEHSHEFITKLVPVQEEGPQGIYYAISFLKGEKLDAETLAEVKAKINDIHERTVAIDQRLNSASAKGKKEVSIDDIPIINEDDDEEMMGGVKFPEKDEGVINAKDIPF